MPLTGPTAARRLADRLGLGPVRGEQPAAADRLVAQQVRDSSIVDLGPQPQYLDGAGRAVPAAIDRINSQQMSLAEWWLDRLVTTTEPFVEKLTWFWHGHFATGAIGVGNPNLMALQNQTQRRLAAGSFAELTASMVVDPAMLVWLNGDQNRVTAPNENLGRELMELFTLGVGNYTEADVKEAARALTGWHVDQQRLTATLVPKWFDAGPKTVLGAPVDDAASLAAMLTARPEAARFVVRRIWRRYVSADPAPDDAVERLAGALGPQRDVRAMMGALAAEPALLDEGSVLVKQPVEWAVGLMRALGVRPAALGKQDTVGLREWLRAMGQHPFEAPSVGGWPDGYSWLTTSAAYARWWCAGMLAKHADLTPVTGTAQAGRPEALGALLGVETWSARTRVAMRDVTADPLALVAVGACAPEYVVSR